MIKHLESSEEFTDIIKKDIILLDFYADWCGPCKMLMPVLDEVDFCDIVKIDVDKFSDIAQKFGIMSIPTLIFFKNGLEQAREIGYRGIDELKETFKNIK